MAVLLMLAALLIILLNQQVLIIRFRNLKIIMTAWKYMDFQN